VEKSHQFAKTDDDNLATAVIKNKDPPGWLSDIDRLD